MSTTQSIAQALADGDATDSKIWACPNGCGYHIADGPVPDGEPTTNELIAEHLEYECGRPTGHPIIRETVEEARENDACDACVAAGETDCPHEPELVDATGLGLVDADPSVVAAVASIVRARAIADGLHQLADFVEANPSLVDDHMSWTFERMLVPVYSREAVAEMARAGMASRVPIAKHATDSHAGVDLTFGAGVSLHVYGDRDQVCERIVVGTHEVTEEVPDPEALAAVPKVTVTKTVEDVRWECRPFLAADPTPEVVAAHADDFARGGVL